jgi:hypothetical protein
VSDTSQDIAPLVGSPAAFANLATKINELVWFVNALKSARGAAPFKINWSGGSQGPLHTLDVEQFQGWLDQSGISQNISGQAAIAASAGTPEGAAISVVGSNGQLNLVPKHSTWVTPTAYPTTLAVVNAGSGTSLTIDQSSLAHNMSIVTIACCNSGTPASMDIVGSAPY